MLTRKYLEQLIEQKLISSTRVVPVPFESSWCIDAIVRTPLTAGSRTETVATSGSEASDDRLRKFDSIDDAALFLSNVGIRTFIVDTADSVSFAQLDTNAVRVVEQTMRLYSDEDDEDGGGLSGAA